MKEKCLRNQSEQRMTFLFSSVHFHRQTPRGGQRQGKSMIIRILSINWSLSEESKTAKIERNRTVDSCVENQESQMCV